MNPTLTTLLLAAREAPSADNMQPWGFAVDEAAGHIAILPDGRRKLAPGLPDEERMGRFGVGAIVENVLQTARLNGWDVVQGPAAPPAVAVFQVRSAGEGGEVDPAVRARVTNRRMYDGHPIPHEVLRRLEERTPPLEGVVTYWITERSRLPALGSVFGRGDALRFSDPAMRGALLSKVRFDRPNDPCIDQGLSLGSLELSGAERLTLKLVPRLPEWLLRASGAMRALGDKARRQVESASGVCLVTSPDEAEATDLLVGRALQRAWLALTVEGLQAQPVMSLVGLETMLRQGAPDTLTVLRGGGLEGLCAEGRRLLPEVGKAAFPGGLLRFGYAPPPTARCGRLPLEDLLLNS